MGELYALSSTVNYLISLKREGGYWDFKQSWYEDKGELLLDIICMANNMEDQTAFIILGVKDHTMEIVGVESDPNRMKLSQLSQFVASKPFAVYTPEFDLQTITMDDHEIDVIIINATTHTPYYLETQFVDTKFQKDHPQKAKSVMPGQIYLRLNDRKAGVDRAAPYSCIEFLWKKRFGLSLSPLERMQIFLEHKEDWPESPGECSVQYYRFAPEFTIAFEPDDISIRPGYEFYILNQVDNTPHWGTISLKYHQTVLMTFRCVVLDGGRHFSPCPEWDGIHITPYGTADLTYRYWAKGTLGYIVHDFFLNSQSSDAVWSDCRFLENILIFSNETEHQKFNEYVRSHWEDKNRYEETIELEKLHPIEGYNMEYFEKQIHDTKIMQKMLIDFRTYCDTVAQENLT